MTLSFNKQRLISLGKKSIPYIAFLIAMISVLSLKINLHVDEVYTYGLSNGMDGIYAVIEDGRQYPGTDTPIHDYMTVQRGERLEFGNVWENQKNDVHPPLYYAFIHLVSSFFPDQFSIWQAGFVNILFGELSLFIFRKLCRQMSDNQTLLSCLTFMFIFSAGILMNVSFLRMYVMCGFWVLLLSYLVIYQMNGHSQKWIYPAMGCAAVAGAITHYYSIVYTVAISFFYGLYLLTLKKDWRTFLIYLLTMLLAAGCSWLIFPAMIDHLFSGYRGTEALSNFSSSGGYLENLWTFVQLIDTQMFGGFLLEIILAALGIWFYTSKWPKNKQFLGQWSVLALSTIVYFLLIAKVAPYQTDRYMFPIYPLIMLLITMPVLIFILHTWSSKTGLVVSFGLIGMMTGFSLENTTWFYLQRDSAPLLQKAKENSDKDSIFIYDESWEVMGEIEEMQNYNSVTFVNTDNLDEINSIPVKNNSEFVLNIPTRLNPDVYVKELMDKYQLGTEFEKLGSYGYGASFLIKK